MACQCATCKLSKKIQRLRPKWNKQTLEVVNELWGRMECAETDAEVLELRMKGEWPSHSDSGRREVIVKVDGKIKKRYWFAE